MTDTALFHDDHLSFPMSSFGSRMGLSTYEHPLIMQDGVGVVKV